MPNLISFTQRGDDVLGLGDAIKQGIYDKNTARYAGSILKHPALMPLVDLIFPKPVADGTLTGVIKKHGYEAAPSLVFTDSPETYKFKANPEVDAALTRQKAQMDAGVSGTFLPGSVSGMK
jgi:hypothetical protein